MRIKKILPKIQNLFLFIIAFVFLLSSNAALAISRNDYENLHTPFYDDCAPPSDESGKISTNIDKVFMVGDSITYAASLSPHNMKQAFDRKGIEAVISGTGAGAINSVPPNATGDKLTALQAIDKYEDDVKNSDAIIVAHGTNHFPDNAFRKAIGQMIKKIKSVKDPVAIFWVNTYTTKSGSSSSSTEASKKKNKIISNLSSEFEYEVIDVTNAGIKLAPDKIHPDYNESGIGKWRDTIINAVVNASAKVDSSNIKYKAMGNIPLDGRKAKATVYGTRGEKDANGKYIEYLGGIEGGPKDEKGKALKGQTAVAEMKGNTALGKLPYGEKIEITYKGKSVIAAVVDNGPAGASDIDLWRQTADLLGAPYGNIEVTIRGVDKKTPVTPVNGQAQTQTEPEKESSSVDELCCPNGESAPSDTSLTGSDNEEKVWNFFKSKGLGDHQVAGIMGNIAEESAFDPTKVEGGSQSETPPGSGGWGLIQWTPGTKAVEAAKDAGINGPIHELATQLELVWGHMQNKPPITTGQFSLKDFKKIDNHRDATSYFETHIEGAGEPRMPDRWASAEAAFKKYGGTGGGGSSGGSSGGAGCVCEDPGSSGKVVVLDPGHSGVDKQGQEKDSKTGIYIGDSSNPGERQQMWKVSEKIREKLEARGFQVIVTKKKEDSYVNLKKRAAIANNAGAAIAVSLHNTPGQFGSESVGWVTPQKVGGYRVGNSKVEFKNKDVADKSLAYSEAILEERKKTEGGVQLHDISFNGRPGLSPGNLPVVQLFSKVPWVYNEVGQSGFNENKYADGIANGIIKALGDSAGGGSGGSCTGAVSGDIQATVKNYAYASYHPAPYNKPKKAYADAIAKAIDDGQYVGGSVGGHPGIDCGGFVTRAMIDSGFEPKYNFSGKLTEGASNTTGGQIPWLDSNWEKINASSTKDLQPGDVAINDNHTFLYVGKIKGFNDVFASASYSSSGNGRAPMAGQGDAMSGAYNWYRKK